MKISRRFLGLPAWAWPLLATVVIVVAANLPPPQPANNPPKVSQIFEPPLLFTIDPDGEHQAVPHKQRASVSPLWTVAPITTQQWSVTRYHPWGPFLRGLGFFVGKSTWTYKLTATRFDAGPSLSAEVPAVDDTKLRQLAVNELNQHTGGKRTGDTLAHLLDHPLERSTIWCAQNLVVLLAWIGLLLAVAAVVWMFVPTRREQTAN